MEDEKGLSTDTARKTTTEYKTNEKQREREGVKVWRGRRGKYLQWARTRSH